MLRRQLTASFLALGLGVVAPRATRAQTTVRGAGATFPHPLYAQWAAEYERDSGGIRVAYEPVGSGEGVARITRGVVDFGASDAPLDEAELRRIGVLQFPIAFGGVVPVVNLRGIAPGELKLTGLVLGDIYLGQIRKWNEAAITALNPGLDLPNENITVVRRAEASGTSFLWTRFLAVTNPEWKARIGAATKVSWPVGVGGSGNEGIASFVHRTRASIGYVEFAYARRHQLKTVSVRNREGSFVRPSRESFEAAASAATWNTAGDLAQLLIDAPGAGSWPITGSTFILVRLDADGRERRRRVFAFFGWALKHGMKAAVDLDYVPLPPAAIALIERLWADALN